MIDPYSVHRGGPNHVKVILVGIVTGVLDLVALAGCFAW